jgi:DNA-binding CsgD family transcriptional regulator
MKSANQGKVRTIPRLCQRCEATRIARLAPRIAYAATPNAAIGQTLATAGRLIEAHAFGIYLIKDRELEVFAKGVRDGSVDRYLAFGPQNDPLLIDVAAHHRPLHEAQVFDEREWQRQGVYEEAIAPVDLCHYLLAPIVAGGAVIGAVTFGRSHAAPAFAHQDLGHAGALSSHLSVRLAWFESQQGPKARATGALTPRELEVALLVQRGFTNSEIAAIAGVSVDLVKKGLKSTFRKMQVTRRAELAWALTSF